MGYRHRRRIKREEPISANERSWKEMVSHWNAKYKWPPNKKEYVERDKGTDGIKMENSE